LCTVTAVIDVTFTTEKAAMVVPTINTTVCAFHAGISIGIRAKDDDLKMG
jgi:hypothetical protein